MIFKESFWLNIKDYKETTIVKVHIAPSLLISSCLELNSFHGLPYHIVSYLIIDLSIWCKRTFILARSDLCACFHLNDFVSFDNVGCQIL
jgi:hypothetical protein